MDYSRWDALALQEEKEEVRMKEEQRRKNQQDYLKQQQERIQAYEQQQQQQRTSTNTPTTQAHSDSHSDSHTHSHDHDHDHDHSHHDHTASPTPSTPPSSSSSPPYRRSCGCGFADVDSLLALQKEAEVHPGPSKAEKDAKKVDAIHAVREHGKILFDEHKYEEAFAVYERGSLILSGMYDLEPSVQDEMSVMEVLFLLNQSLCQLKLSNPTSALHYARSALQLDPHPTTSPTSLKAHIRCAQALVSLGRWDEARAELAEVRGRDAGYPGLRGEEVRLSRLEEEERRKERAFRERMRDRMQREEEKAREHSNSGSQPTGT